MTTLELLQEAYSALNQVKCTKLRGEYADTYKLASAIGHHIKETEDYEHGLMEWAGEYGYYLTKGGWCNADWDAKEMDTPIPDEQMRSQYDLSSIKSK